MALADDLQRAHSPDTRGLGGYSGSAYRRESHRIHTPSMEARYVAFGLLRCMPALIVVGACVALVCKLVGWPS